MAEFVQEATIAERVEQIIRRQTGSTEELTPETDLLNDLEVDSLELVELGLILEKEFKHKLNMAELRRCLTVGEIVQFIEQTLAKAQAQAETV